MEAFPQDPFTVKAAGAATNIKPCTVLYYLDNFVQRGILKVTKVPGNGNLYEFDPVTHGIFRAMAGTNEETVFREMPRIASEERDSSSYMAQAI